MDNYTMDNLRLGECGRVNYLDISGSMRRRLQDIGLIDGTRVECVSRSPFGDPVAFEIRGAVIAIRRKDCQRIYLD